MATDDMSSDQRNTLDCGVTDVMIKDKEPEAPDINSSNSTSDSGSSKTYKREKWPRKLDFLFACLGMSTGLGNVWRFPYLCYKNGGGAFLVPYFVCVFVAGIPLFFMEVALGQFMSAGGVHVWGICPLLQGIGYATNIILFLLSVYYNVIIAWAFHYLFASFTTVLPWSHCHNPWNTQACLESVLWHRENRSIIMEHYNGSLAYNESWTSSGNMSISSFVDPAAEYWERKVLQISGGLDDIGPIKWDLALCLLLAWVVVYLCVWKGIKSSGKVVYFTATAPVVLILILLVRGATLPGALDGIRFYIVPEWHKLRDPQVWVDAGTQVFFSYSIAIGVLTVLGSYNNFNHNCFKDAVIFSGVNTAISFMAGFVIFSVLGFMSQQRGIPISQVAESGPGLAFVAYPKAVAQMPFAPVWSALFFAMVILLGIDSQFVGVEGLVTAVVDEFPSYLRRGNRREYFTIVVCVLCMLIGLTMVTHGGMYIFQLFDYYCGSRIIVLLGFFECVAVTWIYGVDRFNENLRQMLGFDVGKYITIVLKFVTPTFTLVIFSMCMYSYSELTYNRAYIYPWWGILSGWTIASTSVLMIPLVMVVKLYSESGTMSQRVRKLMKPCLQDHQLTADLRSDDHIDCPHTTSAI